MWNARPLLRMPGGSPPQAEGGCDMSHHRTTILVTNPRVISARRPLSSRSRFTTSTRGRPSGYASRSQEDKSNLPLTAYARRFAFRSRLGTRPCVLTCVRSPRGSPDVRRPSSMAIPRVCRALHMEPAIFIPFFRSQIPNCPRLSMSPGCKYASRSGVEGKAEG